MKRTTRQVLARETVEIVERCCYTAPSGRIVNIAADSAKNPGGGFLNGAEAQEEALSRSSALHACLLCAPAYYARNRSHDSCLYLDLLIASPRVPFFRDDEGQLLEEPVLVSVITAPAPNAGAVRHNESGRVAEIKPALRRRARLVLEAAAREGIEHLVLGAWGCGVFRNDPQQVARAFADLLLPGCPYATMFTKVVFAIFDPSGTGPNLQAFRQVFASAT
ncbi:MAG: TIGR02452 family protein [Prosthecobacter sp.]